MNYKVPTTIKTFHCKECDKTVTTLIWKEISNNLNGPQFKCESCWEKFDMNLDKICKSKLSLYK